MTVHLPPEQEQAFQKISDECGLTVEQLVHRAINNYILFNPQRMNAYSEALAEAERDGWITDQDSDARIEDVIHEKGFARRASF